MTKNATKIIRSCLAGLFMAKKGNSHLKSITCSVLLTFLTSSPSWGGASPIHHSRGPPQSPKATKNTTEISRFASAVFFIGKEGYSPLRIIKCKVSLTRPTPSPSWGGTSPIRCPRGPPQSPTATKNTAEITRFTSALFFTGKEGYSPLKIIKC